jgi:hypothetical protein
MPTIVKQFDSLDTFADYLVASGKTTKSMERGDTDFYGCDFYTAIERACRGGDAQTVERIEALVDEIECEMPTLPMRGTMVPEIVGFIPHIPNYVAGLPDAMLTYSEQPSEAAPLRIAVDVCCSGGVNAESMAKRGAAVAAFAYLASSRRPVELLAIAGMNSGGERKSAQVPVVHLGNSPLDVGAVAFALTDPAMLRRLCFSFAEIEAGDNDLIRWGWNSRPTNGDYQDNMRKAAGLTSDDVFLHGGYLNDSVFDNPVQWVQDMLKQHCDAADE